MRTVEKTLPSGDAVLLAEVKEHLRIDGIAEDAHLNALTCLAVRTIEQAIGITVTARTFDVYLDAWPLGAKEMSLPVRPLQSVSAVTIIDKDEIESVWPAANYTIRPGLDAALVVHSGVSWPLTSRPLESIRITCTAGFGDSWNDIPSDIRQAILLLITRSYFSRGDSENVNANALKASGAMALLAPYRRARL